MNQIIARVISSFLCIIVAPIIVKWTMNSKKNIKKKDEANDSVDKKVKVIKYPYRIKLIMWILSCLLFSIIPFLFIVPTTEDMVWPYAILLFVALVLPFLIFSTCWTVWKIEVHKEYLVYRNYFGKKRKYYYKDLTEDINRQGTRWYLVKDGKRVVCLASSVIEDTYYLGRAYYKFKEKERRRERIIQKQEKNQEKITK